MSAKSTISIGPDRDDPPRFTRQMAERGRHVVGDTVIREAKPRGRPAKGEGERKEAVSLRLSPEVLAHFRATGAGWQTRIDEVLRLAVCEGRSATGAVAAAAARDAVAQAVESPELETRTHRGTLFERMSNIARNALHSGDDSARSPMRKRKIAFEDNARQDAAPRRRA